MLCARLHFALTILSDISSSFSIQITKSDIIEMIARETSGTYKDCLQAAGWWYFKLFRYSMMFPANIKSHVLIVFFYKLAE